MVQSLWQDIQVHFTGTGVINVADVNTGTTGKAVSTGTSPKTVGNGWTYQAQFAGGIFYNPVNSAIQTYNTVKHTSSLVFPSLAPNGPWSILHHFL